MLPQDKSKFSRAAATLVESVVVLAPFAMAAWYISRGMEIPPWLRRLVSIIVVIGTVRWAGKGTVKAAKGLLSGGGSGK